MKNKTPQFILTLIAIFILCMNGYSDGLSEEEMKGCRRIAKTYFTMGLHAEAKKLARFLKYLNSKDKRNIKLITNIKKNTKFKIFNTSKKQKAHLAEILIKKSYEITFRHPKWYHTSALYMIIANVIDPENNTAIDYIVKEKSSADLDITVKNLIVKSKTEKNLHPTTKKINQNKQGNDGAITVVKNIKDIDEILEKTVENKKANKDEPDFYLYGRDLIKESKKLSSVEFSTKYRNKIIEINAPFSSFKKSAKGYTVRLARNIIEIKVKRKMIDIDILKEVKMHYAKFSNRKKMDEYFIDKQFWAKTYKARKLFFAPLTTNDKNGKIEQIYTVSLVATLAQGSSRKILLRNCKKIKIKIESKNEYFPEDEVDEEKNANNMK